MERNIRMQDAGPADGQKRPIDRQRESAFSLRVGGDDKSPITELVSTPNALYVIKEAGIYRILLADDIDLERRNPSIVNLSQKILNIGSKNIIVGRTVLTALSLFKGTTQDNNGFMQQIIDINVDLAKEFSDLDILVVSIIDNICNIWSEYKRKAVKREEAYIPSVLTIEDKVRNVIIKFDKIRDIILKVFLLYFQIEDRKNRVFDSINKAFNRHVRDELELIREWDMIASYLKLIRNIRNACEHPRDSHKAVVQNSIMNPDGSITPPTIIIQHKETQINRVLLTAFIYNVYNSLLMCVECTLTLIRKIQLADNNPLQEEIVMVCPSQRRHQHVRYYRVATVGGRHGILG